MAMVEQVTEIPSWTLGDRIVKARRHAHLEQRELAVALGVSAPLISKWERDVAEPRPSQVMKIAEATGVPYGWIVGADPRSRCFMRAAALPVPDQLEFDLESREARLVSLAGGLALSG